jgi:predicted transcriptional regulator
MEVNFPPELEAKLAQSAARQGRDPDDLLRDVLTRHFEEESRFVDAVKRGEAALRRGEYLTHEQVGERLRRRTGAALIEAMQASPYKDVDLPTGRDL